ncbi:MAG: FkbM family methyltransferase, partial [Phycisphaeraceae bacterium]
IDGIRHANTYALERRGWRGVCVEAHPGFIALLRENRPGSTVFHAAAAGEASDSLTFYADPAGDLSSLDKPDDEAMAAAFGAFYRGVQAIEVPARTLDDMLEEANAPAGFEVLSMDIEGAETQALAGLDLHRWRPRVIVLEASDDERVRTFRELLEPAGYRLPRRLGINAFFARRHVDRRRLRLARIDGLLYHPPHPSKAEAKGTTGRPWGYETRAAAFRRVVTDSFKSITGRAG